MRFPAKMASSSIRRAFRRITFANLSLLKKILVLLRFIEGAQNTRTQMVRWQIVQFTNFKLLPKEVCRFCQNQRRKETTR
jgi:hypothetical protein